MELQPKLLELARVLLMMKTLSQCFLLGDPAYSLMPCLMKEHAMVEAIDKRNIIECFFGRLKTRVGALKRAMDIKHR